MRSPSRALRRLVRLFRELMKRPRNPPSDAYEMRIGKAGYFIGYSREPYVLNPIAYVDDDVDDDEPKANPR